MAQQPVSLNKRAITARETFGLGAGFLLAGVAHLLRLPLWLSALISVILIWRLYLAFRKIPSPRKWLLVLIALAAAAGILFEYRTLLGRDAGVALLVVMLALKLLETQTQRDGTLLGFLLYSQTIGTALYMLVCAWLLITVLIGMQFTGPWPGWRQPAQRAGLLLLQAIPLMLVLFLLFPRIQGPLWGLPHDAHAGLSGLSDNMSPGSLNSLILSDAVAFRAAFRGRIPEARALYWRGPVLWDYDGRTWTAPRFVFNIEELPAGEPVIEYTVTLEPHNKRWLFALELPTQRPPRAVVTKDMQLLSTTLVRNRMRYEMSSQLQSSYGADESEAILRRALQLPDGFNPRTIKHAQELRRKFRDDRQLVDTVLTTFRNENYVYTLSPPLLGEHAVDEFLFDTRRGFCEHYASSFTFLMRAAGIPARVVTGYQGGQINPVGDYVLIRQADAHAWTEIWLSGSGWVRIDPTAAVSPARVERGIASALPSSDELPIFVRGNFEFLQSMRLTLDTVTYTWNQWVLGYNPERQRQFLANIGFNDASWQMLAVILFVCAGVAVLLGAVVALRDLRSTRNDVVRAAYDHFCRKLARRGLPRKPAEGPMAYAYRAAQWNPQAGQEIDAISRDYVALRYGTAATADSILDFKRRVNTLKI
jgi:transglutaminase-like putative cysteine protease